ncbi:hypothetical protein BH23GEM9_BH23GEM9_07720 [soil metagenome]
MPRNMLLVATGVFVVGLIFDYLLFSVALRDHLINDVSMRAAGEGPWPKIMLGELIFAAVVSWVYARGATDAPALGQGLRFGLALGLIAVAGGLIVAPVLTASETIIIGGIAGLAMKSLAQGMTAAMIAGDTGATPGA